MENEIDKSNTTNSNPDAGAGAPPPEAEGTQAALEALQKELQAAQAKAAEYLDGWQRSRAELANYKRRIEKEQSEI